MNVKGIFHWLTNPPIDGPNSTLLLRLMAGGVFFWEEEFLKFVYVNQGVGRFTRNWGCRILISRPRSSDGWRSLEV